MKTNLILSLLFAIVTTYSALHEIEHITHDEVSCSVFHINNLVPLDVVAQSSFVKIVNFDKVISEKSFIKLYFKTRDNQNRGPPLLS